jgi:transposase
VVLEQQLVPGTFEFALHTLIDTEFDLLALAAKFRNDETGAPAYDPAVMLKIVLLAYSRDMVSSRAIERACAENVLFMAISGDTRPAYTTVAAFVRGLSEEITAIFTEVILICERQGPIGRQIFAIDGVKLPGNASKAKSGTHAELAHQASAIEHRVKSMLSEHRKRDAQGEPGEEDRASHLARVRDLKAEARSIRAFLQSHAKRQSGKAPERKSNLNDNDSAKMATGKGVIQGYTGAASVDAAHQIIVAAQAHGSGSEQVLLAPMIEQARPFGTDKALFTADAGYHSEANLKALSEQGIGALIADGLMRSRDERFKGRDKYKARPDPLYDKAPVPKSTRGGKFTPQDFSHDPAQNTCTCPAGASLYSNGSRCTTNGGTHHKFTGAKRDCVPCELRARCLRTPDKTRVRQAAFFHRGQASPLTHTEAMKRRIDSLEGRALYGRRIATVEPVFGNLRHNKRLDRFTLRGHRKVDTQWKLYCMVHNIEKLSHHRYAQ